MANSVLWSKLFDKSLIVTVLDSQLFFCPLWYKISHIPCSVCSSEPSAVIPVKSEKQAFPELESFCQSVHELQPKIDPC